MGETVRLKRGAILLRNDMSLIVRSDADLEELFALVHAVLAELVDDEGGQRDGASPPALRLLQSRATFRLFRALRDRKLPASKIDGTPAQSGDFAATQATEDGEQHRDEHARATEVGDQDCRLGRVEGVYLAAFDLRRIDLFGWIADNQVPAHRRRKRLLQDPMQVVNGAGR